MKKNEKNAFFEYRLIFKHVYLINLMNSQALFLRDYALKGDLFCYANDIACNNFFDTGKHSNSIQFTLLCHQALIWYYTYDCFVFVNDNKLQYFAQYLE